MGRKFWGIQAVISGETRFFRTVYGAILGLMRLKRLSVPGYAPDLNPDELVCSHAKRTGVARSPLKAGENLQCRVDAQLQNIADNPALVKAFFRHPSVSYITD